MLEHKLERLHRRIQGCDSPQAVVRYPDQVFQFVPVGSARLDALLISQKWSKRIIGVFSPEVSIDLLRENIN